MTDDMMTLRSLLEKSSDAELLGEIESFKPSDSRALGDRPPRRGPDR